jgi:2-C-methyl-D-erythritol 4-phosphate cytidylyltransferase
MTPFTLCIPAAGSGSRMNSSTPKQFLPLHGRAVLLHTLDVFFSMHSCREIIIAGDEAALKEMLREVEMPVPVRLVAGGARRQDSVANAIDAVEGDDAVVLVHDAARPCVFPDHIQAVADAVQRFGAAVLAIPARDTLKEVRDGMIAHTIDRSTVWQAQTPQGARVSLFRDAFRHAVENEIQATDDVSLIEALGHPVHIVEGDATNIKITQPEDLIIAETLLRAQGRGGNA